MARPSEPVSLSVLKFTSVATSLFLVSVDVAPASATVRTVPGQYATVQAAVDHSVNGDTIVLAPGIHHGPGNRDIELRGLDLTITSSAGAEATVIDCEWLGRGFYLHEGESPAARIEAITIKHGEAPGGDWPGVGGGILCVSSSPTLSNLRVVDCQAQGLGGGLYLINFDGILEESTISGNYANAGGGGLNFEFGNGLIRRCVFSGNGSPIGGGITFNGIGPNHLTECTITANFAGGDAGGIKSYNLLTLDRCILWGNCSILGVDELTVYIEGADINCSLVDPAGVSAPEYVRYDGYCVFTDPKFCDPWPCGWFTGGGWTVDASSPCLPEHSPCGQLIGALGAGCGAPPATGACCLPSAACVVVTQTECVGQSGSYQGDGTDCEPDPCTPVAVRPSTWGGIKARFAHK